jgi:hypothetical protein
MDTWIKRIQLVLYFAGTVLFVLGLGSHFTVAWRVPSIKAELSDARVRTFHSDSEYVSLHERTAADRAIISFNVKADLSDVWDWNVGSVFVWVKAAYATKNRVRTRTQHSAHSAPARGRAKRRAD